MTLLRCKTRSLALPLSTLRVKVSRRAVDVAPTSKVLSAFGTRCPLLLMLNRVCAPVLKTTLPEPVLSMVVIAALVMSVVAELVELTVVPLAELSSAAPAGLAWIKKSGDRSNEQGRGGAATPVPSGVGGLPKGSRSSQNPSRSNISPCT